MSSVSSPKNIQEKSGTFTCTVYYEDTDFSGFVYHANYLKFFERAREELLGPQLLRDLYQSGFHYVVTRAEVDFKRPAKHADQLLIKTRMVLDGSPITMTYQEAYLLDENNTPQPKPLVHAVIKLVSVNGEGKVCRIPKGFVNSLAFD